MAYNKYTWVDGELITAEKLNHMEDGIAEGGGCDCGFECSEERTTLFEGTVSTAKESDAATVAMGSLSYPQFISNNKLVVTLDGTTYNCEKQSVSSTFNAYGATFTDDDESDFAPDFSEYPFIIVSQQTPQTPPRIINGFVTPTAGEHTIKIQSSMTTAEISECFKAAVNSVVSPLVVHRSNGYLDKTWREISNALMGRGAVIATQINAEGDYTVVPIISAYVVDSGGSKSYKVSFYEGDPMYNYSASSPEDYPSIGQN